MVRSTGSSQDRSAAVVLVIDDSASIRRLLQISLRKDFDVLCVEKVDDGIRLLKEKSPDFIFIDYDMPGKNGLDGIREIRSFNRQIPIVLLTGSATRELIRDALREGANECLPKPFEMSVLKDVIFKHLSGVSTLLPQPTVQPSQDVAFSSV